MTEIGSIIDGKYEILKKIGQGGMSVVYLAMDLRLNKQWAVKEIKKKDSTKNDEVVVNSLLAEANLMKRLDHPSLPRIVDIIDNGQTIYVVMDYIEGGSLDKILSEYGAQPQELVIDWAKQLCDALGYLHSQNPPIIYRDMKPANVMLKPEGNLKVIDFGIAREYKEQNLADTVSLGTKGYAAPEQFGGKGQTDARTDIYCLGVTLYHLVTGQNPCEPPYELYPIRQWNPVLSGGLERIIQKCTQLNPADRYQNCDELMYALEHYEEIDDVFRKKQGNKLLTFILTSTLAIVMAVSGVACKFSARQVNKSNYDSLILVVDSTAYNEKISSYKQAIAIYPYDARAYIRMLEAYEGEGKFGKTENDEFLALYNANREGFNLASVEFAELNYKIGMMYFNYYFNDELSSFSTRVQKAYSFFKTNNENAPAEFSAKSLSNCYYQICTFYKKYILSSANVEEASRDNYMKLFEVIEEALKDVESAGAYDKLTLYNGTFMLLYDQRTNMASVNVDKETVLNLLDTVNRSASNLTVNKEQSQKLQSEINDNFAEYSEAIKRAYTNAEERK